MRQYHVDNPCKHFLVKILGKLNAGEVLLQETVHKNGPLCMLSEQRPRVLFLVVTVQFFWLYYYPYPYHVQLYNRPPYIPKGTLLK